MKIELNTDAKVKYSDREIELFDMLPKEGKVINSKELVAFFYKKKIPINGQVIIMGTMRSLRNKMKLNKEPFAITTSDRSGPIPMSFRISQK